MKQQLLAGITAFSVLNAEWICSIIKEDNFASQQVAKRVGMKPEKEFMATYYNRTSKISSLQCKTGRNLTKESNRLDKRRLAIFLYVGYNMKDKEVAPVRQPEQRQLQLIVRQDTIILWKNL